MEKPFKTILSNHHPQSTAAVKPRPKVPCPKVPSAPPGMALGVRVSPWHSHSKAKRREVIYERPLCSGSRKGKDWTEGKSET